MRHSASVTEAYRFYERISPPPMEGTAAPKAFATSFDFIKEYAESVVLIPGFGPLFHNARSMGCTARPETSNKGLLRSNREQSGDA